MLEWRRWRHNRNRSWPWRRNGCWRCFRRGRRRFGAGGDHDAAGDQEKSLRCLNFSHLLGIRQERSAFASSTKSKPSDSYRRNPLSNVTRRAPVKRAQAHKYASMHPSSALEPPISRMPRQTTCPPTRLVHPSTPRVGPAGIDDIPLSPVHWSWNLPQRCFSKKPAGETSFVSSGRSKRTCRPALRRTTREPPDDVHACQ